MGTWSDPSAALTQSTSTAASLAARATRRSPAPACRSPAVAAARPSGATSAHCREARSCRRQRGRSSEGPTRGDGGAVVAGDAGSMGKYGATILLCQCRRNAPQAFRAVFERSSKFRCDASHAGRPDWHNPCEMGVVFPCARRYRLKPRPTGLLTQETRPTGPASGRPRAKRASKGRNDARAKCHARDGGECADATNHTTAKSLAEQPRRTQAGRCCRRWMTSTPACRGRRAVAGTGVWSGG